MPKEADRFRKMIFDSLVNRGWSDNEAKQIMGHAELEYSPPPARSNFFELLFDDVPTQKKGKRYSRNELHELIRRHLLETPDWSDNRIGKEIGCDGKTVKKIRIFLESTMDFPKLERFLGVDGRRRRRDKSKFTG